MKIELIFSIGLRHGMCLTQITLESGESTENHFHQKTTEVYLVSSGTGVLICDNERHSIGPNSTFVIHPYTRHELINTDIVPLIVTSCKDKPQQFRDMHPV